MQLLRVLTTSVFLITAQYAKASEIQVVSGETRPTLPAEAVGVGYFVVTVSGRSGEQLTDASSTFAANVSINETVMVGGTEVSRPVPGGIAIPANGTIVFEPGGYHLALSGISSQINLGDLIPVSLDFGGGGIIEIVLVAASG